MIDYLSLFAIFFLAGVFIGILAWKVKARKADKFIVSISGLILFVGLILDRL